MPPPPPPSPPQHELNNNDTDSEEEELVAEVVLNEVDDEFEAWWTRRGGGAVTAENGNAIGGVNHDGITIEHVRDGVVSNSTLKKYVNEILNFSNWCLQHQHDWLTDFGSRRLQQIQQQRPGERHRPYRIRVKLQFKTLLRFATEDPLIHLDAITPEGYMAYIMHCRHSSHHGYLSKSAYGDKRAAFFHLFRLHNRLGFPDEFARELANLFRGFFRQLVNQPRPAAVPGGAAAPADGAAAPAGTAAAVRRRAMHKEGKDPLSVDLYADLCLWFLQWGTLEGVFAYCFLVLSWNLACRANNTADIRFNQISWASSFDSFEIYFGHTKTDQTGDDAKYPRHIYANPLRPIVCPVFALSLYFTCCFNVIQTEDDMLFPGPDQYQRFSDNLERVISQHPDEVRNHGYEPSEIGTHSIRKGAISYVASLPGGPTAASVCIRAGWSMGTVRDIYMRYVSSGDEFVGRCLSLLPLLKVEFGSSPPFFVPSWVEWAEEMKIRQFPMVSEIGTFGRMTRMCLASIVKHRQFCLSLQPNHVIRVSSIIFRDEGIMTMLDRAPDCVAVSHPWSDDFHHTFTGIPPHVATLQELTVVKNEQRRLIEGFVDKVKTAIDESGVGGGAMTEARFQTILDGFAADLRVQLEQIELYGNARQVGGGDDAPADRVETGLGYKLHFHNGKYRRVPADWRFPRVGVLDAWRQWWIGDSVRNIPPLRLLGKEDISFLDNIPLTVDEMHGRNGRNKNNRRAARKTYSDLAYLMNYIQDKVQEAGAMTDTITIANVDAMYQVVAQEFLAGRRNAQKKWSTFSQELRRRRRDEANT